MKRERVERLAMDFALGELSEDAAALFDAHLAAHPQAKQWALVMRHTCAVTEKAVSVKTRTPHEESSALRRKPHPAWRVAWPALRRWAAVVMVALLVGAAVGRWGGPKDASRPGVQVTVVRSTVAERSWVRVLNETGHSFWHAKALALLDPKPAGAGLPATSENLWDKYKQYVREQNDE